MSSEVSQPFPTYLELPPSGPQWFWRVFRGVTFAVMLAVTWFVWVQPEAGLTFFWKVMIPSLPLLFAVAPGVWRQICPMAMLNQLPRTLGISRDYTLPNRFRNLAYFISVLAFFILVSLRHLFFNKEPLALLILVFGALALALIGGLLFKGRSGWCGTFCPLAPIQKAYGHAPIVTVKNGYCPTCVGCQKNCYDFNPRAAFFSDLSDSDLWYAGHKKFFVAGLPGFAIGFFTAADPAQTGLFSYYLHLVSWIITTLGLYMALRIFVRISDYRVAGLSAMAAMVTFYFFTADGIVETVADVLGVTPPAWGGNVILGVAALVAIGVLRNGSLAERDFNRLNDPAPEPHVGVDIDAIRGHAPLPASDLIMERASGRSFAAKPGRTLLEGIESVGLVQEFGCRMGVCGVDAIAIVDGAEKLSPPGADELATLRRLGLEGRARMACVCKPTSGGVLIDIEVDPNDLPEPPPPEDEIDYGEKTGIQHVVVIGNGAAGIAAADEIRRMSASCKIDVIAKEGHPFYNRMGIARLLYGSGSVDHLSLMTPDWYEKKDINVWLNTQAAKIDREASELLLGTGETLPYDRLVLAQGSRATLMPPEASELPGCFVLREATDAQAIRSWRQEKSCQHAIVLGGGVLGIEAADALRQLKLKTTIIQRSDRLMNRELDAEGSAVLRHYIDQLGIKVVTGASVASLVGNDRIEGVKLTDGQVLPADIYVVCAGVKPNMEVAAEAGLSVDHGVLVDRHMQTSDPNIFAVGDVAEIPNTVHGLWSVGTAQASVAVNTMFGNQAEYTPPNTLVNLKMDGIDVKSFGFLDAQEGAEEILDTHNPDHMRRRIYVKDGQITAAVIVGPPGTGKEVAEIIQSKTDISAVLDRLKDGDWAALGDV